MTLDEILRRKALAEPMPLSWACDQLAQALRLLKVVEATMPELTNEEKGLKMAVEYLVITLSEHPPMTQAELLEKVEAK